MMKADVDEGCKELNVKKGLRYSLCSCGYSKLLPLCDDAHKRVNGEKGASYKPIRVWSEDDTTLKVFSKKWKKKSA